MWVLFPETLNPIGAYGRNIVGQEQPAFLEPVACSRANVTSHPALPFRETAHRNLRHIAAKSNGLSVGGSYIAKSHNAGV